MTIFASGGIKDGLDIAKCIALGATLGGMAGNFLKAAAVSTEKAVEMMKLTKKQIEVTMFACGVEKLEEFESLRSWQIVYMTKGDKRGKNSKK